MGVNLLPFIDAERVKKIVKNVIDNGALNEKEKKLNQRGENILISKDLEITHYFQGELSIHPEMNTYDKFLKEDSVIKGIHPGDVKKDKSQSFIFKKKVNNIMHCSKVLDGVIPEPKCIIEDNLDNYPKTKFKGKQAIEMVKEVLGTTNDNLEGYFLQETFDDKYGNNNRAVEYDPQKMFLLMKKRYQENQNAITKKKKNNDEINRNNNIDSNSRNTNNNNNKNNIVNNNSNDLNMNNNNKNKSRNNNINNSNDSNGNNINNNNLPIINLDEDKEEVKDVENKKTKKKIEQKKDTKKHNKLLEVMNFLNNKK
jgi:hypothetical protein